MPIQYSLAVAAIVCGSVHTHAQMQGRTSGSVQFLFQRTTVINGTHVRKFLITLISHRSVSVGDWPHRKECAFHLFSSNDPKLHTLSN